MQQDTCQLDGTGQKMFLWCTQNFQIFLPMIRKQNDLKKSIKLNSPFKNFFPKSSAFSSSIANLAFSNNASKSPIPSNLPTKPLGLNSSKSSTFSPVPINFILAPETAQATKAPPAFA